MSNPFMNLTKKTSSSAAADDDFMDDLTGALKQYGAQQEDMEKQLLALTQNVKSLIQGGLYDNYGRKDVLVNNRPVFASKEMAAGFGRLIKEITLDHFTPNLDDFNTKGLSGMVNADGGYLVGEEYGMRIIDLSESYGVYRRNTLRLPMGSRYKKLPKVSSGAIFSKVGEAATFGESNPLFSMVTLIAAKVGTYILISSELLEDDDTAALGEVLARMIAKGLAYLEDSCGLMGDGTAGYFNWIGAAMALMNVDANPANIAGLHIQGTPGSWGAITINDFYSLIGILPSQFDKGAKWYCHKRFYFDTMLPKAAALGGANQDLLLNSSITRNFMGYDVEFSQVMPSSYVAGQVCCLLANLSEGAYLGERRGLTVERSSEVRFLNGQIAIRADARIDFNNHGVGNTSEAGPICGMLTA